MNEHYLLDKYLTARQLENEKAVEMIRDIFEARKLIMALILTRRMKKHQLAAILGISVQTFRKKIRTNCLNHHECITILEGFHQSLVNQQGKHKPGEDAPEK